MIDEIIYNEVRKDYHGVIGELVYGTLITGVKGHSDVFYIKVRKNKSEHSSIRFTPGYCVLLNIKNGNLRAIKGDTVVIVHKGKLETELGVANNYKKRRFTS